MGQLNRTQELWFFRTFLDVKCQHLVAREADVDRLMRWWLDGCLDSAIVRQYKRWRKKLWKKANW
jgi:hypothetical protein